MVYVQLNFNKIFLQFIPFCIKSNFRDGWWIIMYLYVPRKAVICDSVGSIVFSKSIFFAKCHMPNTTIISAHIIDK